MVRNIFRFLLLAVVALALGACTKNEVRLKFSLPSDFNGACRIVYYASAKNVGTVRETVVEIAAGKGEAVLPMRYPAVIYLFSPASRMPGAVIYASRGDKFEITGTGTDVGEWMVKGNKTTEALAEWRRANAPLLGSRKPEELNKTVGEYVKTHPDSKAAAIMLYLYFDRRVAPEEFYRLMDSMAPSLWEDRELTSALSAADLMTVPPVETAIPKEVVLTGADGYGDTLRLVDRTPRLIIFRGSNAPGDGFSMDTLKNLLSAKRTGRGVELFADPDSMAWRRHLRRDTIEELQRLWLPLALADSTAITMGVRRLPFFIVVNAAGKEVYRGDSWEAASKHFKTLQP